MVTIYHIPKAPHIELINMIIGLTQEEYEVATHMFELGIDKVAIMIHIMHCEGYEVVVVSPADEGQAVPDQEALKVEDKTEEA